MANGMMMMEKANQLSDDHPCRQTNTKTVPKKKFSLNEIESSADCSD